MRVLMVEDNPGDATLLSLMLEECGHRDIARVGTLAAALSHLSGPARQRPDVLLLDLMLPDSAGLDSLRAVRAVAPDVATVVLTGIEDDGLALAALRDGAQDYFVKGKLGPEVLDRCIRQAFEREQIRVRVIERESLLRVAYEGANVVPWDWDIDADIVRFGASMLGRPASGPEGVLTKALARVHPDDREHLKEAAIRCIAESGEARMEYRFAGPDGAYRWQLVVLKAGQPRKLPAKMILGVTMDVHRRRMAEGTLRALSQSLAIISGAKFFEAMVLHLAATLGVRWAMIAKIDSPNSMTASMIAVADGAALLPPVRYDLAGSPCAKALSKTMCYIRESAATAFPHDRLLTSMAVESYCGIRLLDSKQRPIGVLAVMHDTKLPEDDEAVVQTLLICATRVAAELERAETERTLEASEAQLRQAQKMEAIGKLASGIAHDFTNLLTAVRGHASLATAMLGPDHPALENLKQLEEAARQASGVAGSLLTFARRSRPDMAPVPLGPMLESSVMLFRAMRPPGAPLDVDISRAKGVIIDADETQVRQMLINLLLNAAEAVQLGGRLRLTVELHQTPAGDAEVQMIVADTGIGMSDEAIAHMFEPFYTTKAHGTGLGLAVVHGVVREHGWRINVGSRPGEGTRIAVSAPVRATVIGDEGPESEGSWTGRRAVVVMRARLARGLVAGTLTEYGLDVSQAADERGAEALIREDHRPIALLVIDAPAGPKVLPDILARVRASEPRAKCIIVGGAGAEGLAGPDVFIIKRPFQLIALKTAMAILRRDAAAMAPSQPGAESTI